MNPSSFSDQLKQLEKLVWSYRSMENVTMGHNFNDEAGLFYAPPQKGKTGGQFQPSILQRSEQLWKGNWRMKTQAINKIKEVSHIVLGKVAQDLEHNLYSPDQLRILQKQIVSLQDAMKIAGAGLDGLNTEFRQAPGFTTRKDRPSQFETTIKDFIALAKADVAKSQGIIKDLLAAASPPPSPAADEAPPPVPPRSPAVRRPAPPPRSADAPPMPPPRSPAATRKPPAPPPRPDSLKPAPAKLLSKPAPAVGKLMPRPVGAPFSSYGGNVRPARPLPVPGAKPAAAGIVKRQDSFEKIEQTFWELHTNDNHLHHLLEMAVGNSDNESAAADFMVSHFVEYMKTADPALEIKGPQIADLKKALVAQFLANNKLKASRRQPTASGAEVELTNTPLLQNGKTLLVFDTPGDGSCGLHAMLGVPVSGRYRCDAAKVRKEFCDWIRMQYDRGNLPPRIQNVLSEYFYRLELAPDEIRGALGKLRELYYEPGVSVPEQEFRLAQFMQDEEVINTYLTILANTGYYLLQDELLAAAQYYNKTIHIYQPGWGDDPVVGEVVIHPGAVDGDEVVPPGDEVVHIWYNGINHYERARVAD